MNANFVVGLGQQVMWLVVKLTGPVLAFGLAIGLIVSIFQAATQINETTLSFIPKLVGIFIALIVAGPWMLSVMLDYMREVFTSLPTLVG